jgi:Protein of unknown function (DUF2934)
MKENAKPTHEAIQLRAYELYLARNGGPADELSDWLAAEKELTEIMKSDQQSIGEGPYAMVPLPTTSSAKRRQRGQRQFSAAG